MLALALLHSSARRPPCRSLSAACSSTTCSPRRACFGWPVRSDDSEVAGWSAIAGRPLVLLVLAMLLAAIAGLPPFPGFLGEMGTGDAAFRSKAVRRHRSPYSGRIASGGGVHVRLVQAGDTPACQPNRRPIWISPSMLPPDRFVRHLLCGSRLCGR